MTDELDALRAQARNMDDARKRRGASRRAMALRVAMWCGVGGWVYFVVWFLRRPL